MLLFNREVVAIKSSNHLKVYENSKSLARFCASVRIDERQCPVAIDRVDQN